MPEWLELELAHSLAPVEAPSRLTWLVPEPRRPRRRLTLLPMLAAAALVAALLLAAPQSDNSPDAVNRYLAREGGIRLAIPSSTRATIERVRVGRKNGVRIAEVTYRLHHTEATVLIAQAGTVRGPQWRPHDQNYVIASADPQFACLLCHSSL